jgi:hypothetical protein
MKMVQAAHRSKCGVAPLNYVFTLPTDRRVQQKRATAKMKIPHCSTLCFMILVSACFILSGCSTIDIFPQERRQKLASTADAVTLQQIQMQVRRQIDPAGSYILGKVLRVVGRDIWNKTLFRWLTPLDENRQTFQAELNTFHQGIAFAFLNGRKKGQVIGFDGRSYSKANGQIIYEERSSTALYLGPLQSYLEWHQTLIRNPTLEFVGVESIGGTKHWVLYATEGNTQHLAEYDQFLIYVNGETKQVAFVEFTLRDLMKSYKGVVHYRDYHTAQGVSMPHWVGIASSIAAPDFDHYLEIDQFVFSELRAGGDAQHPVPP